MNTFNTIEQIEQGISGKTVRFAGISNSNTSGYHLKKIYTGNANVPTWVKEQFPHTELVGDVQSIIDDSHIDLVLVAAPEDRNIDTLAEILKTGKHVRIV